MLSGQFSQNTASFIPCTIILSESVIFQQHLSSRAEVKVATGLSQCLHGGHSLAQANR
ncbi:hypothetical protein DPMN_052496 [Dreissena polymorpha]|uniref:Uncharacterized protein n=1 Tax=Dreissena polymorpha TaxID=45954 RepID=A0A9D4HRC0_DREPO|nr:hypothetical protein DPMN_052496 [Dreissena polymorpha]